MGQEKENHVSMGNHQTLLGARVLPVGLNDAFREVIDRIGDKNGDFFCLCNIHVVMECYKVHALRDIINRSAANFVDGKGLVMGLGILGHHVDFKVRGTDLMLRLCAYAAENGLKIFLYGNTDGNLTKLKRRLNDLFPGINIAGAVSPPFRELTKEEDARFIKEINEADPDLLFVSLGAPKQEIWMAAHKGRINAVQLGVGAAFDFIVGEIKQAPVWMQRLPLEWLHRMPQQPKKTFVRMLLVPKFFFLTFLQLLREGRYRKIT
jgi:N-acetylglucosaminyldiphosphoundecaprenol N-acetyl-beta-D-mannosaminyltransferase